MKLVIDISEDEFGIDIDDKFKDFFSRLKVEIKQHLMTNTSLVCGAYELETIDMFLKAFNNGTPLPKGHGRLFDERDIVDGSYEIIGNRIYELEPILEADISGKE